MNLPMSCRPTHPLPRPGPAAAAWALALLVWAGLAVAVPLDPAVAAAAQQLASERALAAWGQQPYQRIVVKLGQIEPQWRLAACARVEAFLLGGVPPWGATRVGLRCTDTPQGWRISVSATVQIIVSGLVVASGLPAGQALMAEHLSLAEVDAAASSAGANGQAGADPVLTERQEAIGRSLLRPAAAGQALRRSHLRQRQWFAAGDTVQIVAVGPGWSVAGEGRAVVSGLEGQPVRARTDTGQFVTGWATADHRMEIRP